MALYPDPSTHARKASRDVPHLILYSYSSSPFGIAGSAYPSRFWEKSTLFGNWILWRSDIGCGYKICCRVCGAVGVLSTVVRPLPNLPPSRKNCFPELTGDVC